MKRVFILAGETSGDLHGAMLMSAMKERCADIEFTGIGGNRMIGEGLDTIHHVREMNFMGIIEVVRHLPFIRRAMANIEQLIDTRKPDLAILIDYPGFNLRLAPKIKSRGIPLMYYISPQLWAWHTSRVKIVKKYVDRMVVIFPFEREFYRSHGVEADFVGHPLLDVVKPGMDRASFRASIGVTGETMMLGLLPGSRAQEISKILPAMIGAVDILRRKGIDVTGILACAPELTDKVYAPYLNTPGTVPVRGATYDVMAHSDALVVTSGTATLESGILGTPMVVVYKTSPLTYAIAKHLVDIDNIGMINIVAGSRIVPELWQSDVNAESVAANTKRLLGDTVCLAEIRKDLATAVEKLGETGAAGRAAEIACGLLF